MSIPSNLYAEKIFSEHPIALWPLDEKVDFISLISDASRAMTSWTLSGGTASASTETGPILESPVFEISGADPGASPNGTVTCISNTITNFNTLDSTLESFSIGMHFLSQTAEIDSVEFGFRYVDVSLPDVLRTVDITQNNIWGFFSGVFDIPAQNSNFKLVIKINYTKSSTPGATYGFMINGLSIGQRAEEFNRTSIGVFPAALPSSIALSSTSSIVANAYAVNDQPAYYLVNKNAACARNFGVPIVYGASSVTTLYPNSSGLPSMIIPANGFLNKSGQYNDRTLEFWLKVNSGSSGAQRIVGPISSTDGIYVDGPSLTLKIGDQAASHFVGEWSRTLLVAIRVIQDSASLLINGEQVLSLFFKTSDLILPEKYSTAGKDQDWIGFYAPTEVHPIQIDAPAIFSYSVPEIVSKRRFVYGQGVEFPSNVNASYNSTTIAADYQFANYANNYNYPDIGSWESGIIDNLAVDSESISTPSYDLPVVEFDNRTITQWYTDLKAVQGSDSFISLRPNSSDWSGTNGYILFPTFNVLNQDVKAFFGTFKRVGTPTEKQTLVKIYSELNTNYFEIYITGTNIKYDIKYNGVITEITDAAHTISTSKFSVGINIDNFAKTYGANLAAFFGERNLLKITVGGNRDFSNTFSGEIHSFEFSNSTNYEQLSSLFHSSGSILHDVETDNTKGSYALIVKDSLSGFSLDISSKSSWKDYVPLSYFSKYVNDADGNQKYSMDLIQFNINYPEPDTFIGGNYDTSKSLVRTYISFESLKYMANNPSINFTNIVSMNANGTVIPGTDWATTKYEVVNGSIIYLPLDVDPQQLSIAIHAEIQVDGIVKAPIKIKSLQLASLAIDATGSQPIGTRFGVPVYPYTKLGVYMDYKRRNPFTIYKGTSPYLYLTKHSGFRLRGDYATGISRGISTPINQAKSSTFKVGAIQAFMRFEDGLFPTVPVEAFELESSDAYIKFYLVASDTARKRGRIYAINTSTGQIQSDISFYLNGILVNNAIINVKEWYVIGIQLGNKPDFANFSGAFRITGPLTMDNISHFEYTASQEQQTAKARLWSGVKNLPTQTADWDYWTDFNWREVLFVVTTERTAIDPATIYKIYTGTNKIIISDPRSLTFNNQKIKMYQAISWQSQTLTAV